MNYKLKQKDLIKDKEGFFGKVIGINLPVVGQIPVKTKRKKVKNATGLYTCCFLEIENDTTFELRSTFALDISICGSALVVLNHMGYDLNDSKSISLAIKDVDKVFEVYKNLIKTNPELFGGKTIEKSSSKNQKDLSKYEKENNLEHQKAKEITEKNNYKVDDFLRDDKISGNLLEALYDENIDFWFNNVDNFDLKYSLRYIVENKNASKILLKKVFEFREKNILEDELHVHYQDLGSDVCTYLKDFDWGRKLFKQAKVETFKEEVWSEYERYPTSLAFDICTKLGDKVWGKELFKEAEKYCKDVYFAEKLSRVFASDDPKWCKEVYISNINDQKNQNVVALCEIGGSIIAHGLNDKVMATESFQKAESMLTYLTDYLMLAGCVLDKDGLNDKKWSQELIQKGLILYCSVDYKEHPNAKDYGFTNEIDYIISCIENDGRHIWNVMEDWLDTIETISEKLGKRLSKKDAVVDYLDDEYKEKLNSENSDKQDIEIDNVNEVKYINYDEVNWVNPPGWEQDAPYVDGKPFTGIVYENYPNGQRSLEDQYTDGIRHGKQTKFYENGYVHWEKIYEYNKFVKWSVNINDTKHNKPKHETVSEAPFKNETEKASNSIVMSELDFDEDLENYYYPKGTKILFSGIAVEYYSNGQKSLQEEIVDGKNHGKCTSWYENGQLKHEGNFIKGRVVGITKRWYSSGNLEREENWIQDDNDITGQKLLSRTMYNEDGSIKSKTDNNEEPIIPEQKSSESDVSLKSEGDPVENFRLFLANNFPNLKLPKGKKYVEFPIFKGILVCCMIKKDGVNVYLYSGGRVPANEIFDKLNSLGVSGKVLNDKYTITPMPGSRNPNVVRIDLLIPYGGRDLDNDDLRKEVLDVYVQLIDLCMPLNPDNLFHE